MFMRVFLLSLGAQVCEALEEKLKKQETDWNVLGSLSDMCSEAV